MANGITNDPVSKALQFALTGLSRRQEVGSENISNVDTPGFKASGVPFESQLTAALNGSTGTSLLVTNPMHIQPDRVDLTNVRMVTDNKSVGRNDGNNVDVEREMYQLADTTIRYDALTKVITQRLGWLRTVIDEKP